MALNDLLKAISLETDEEFIKRCREITPYLPQNFQEMSEEVLKNIASSIPQLPTKIIFVPIGHWLNVNRQAEKNLKNDLITIFEKILNSTDAIACGETSNNFSKDDIQKQKLNALIELKNLGIIQENPQANFIEVSKIITGFEEALLRLKNWHVLSVDSFEGSILTTALDFKPDLIPNDKDAAISNEIKFRIGTEGRTRYSLNKACLNIKANQRLIFVQGKLHQHGVEGWCKRNNLQYEIVVPKTINRLYLS